jgi:antibiotic biosynthesis monooxygenase (ABM) superfamily enzyme
VNVVLSPVFGNGAYVVRRGGQYMGVMVIGRFVGWDVAEQGVTYRRFRRVSDARKWLDSDEGQAWLDQRPEVGE